MEPRQGCCEFSQARRARSDEVTALGGPMCVTIADPDTNGEPRWVSLGMDGHGRFIVTDFTHRGDAVRVISSRRATAFERRRYQER